MKKPKCKACYDKGYYTQFVGESGSDDFGGEGYSLPPTIKKFPCPKCIRIQNGHKEDCDFVNSDQGVCNCFQPEQKECWRCNLGEPKEFHVCEPNPSKCEHSHEPSSCKHCRPQPEAQMEQKECLDSDHLNHKDCPTKRQWGLEAARAANKAQAKLVKNYNAQCWRCNLGEPKEFHGCEPYPQPTDGLVNYAPILDAGQEGFTGIHAGRYWAVRENCIRKLLTEQKTKTREDTIDECIEAVIPLLGFGLSSGKGAFEDYVQRPEVITALQSLKSKKRWTPPAINITLPSR
jgi:hypothetical protein